MDRHLTDEPDAVLFLEALHRHGFEVCAQQDRLRIRPSHRLDDALLVALQHHKPALLALLTPVDDYVTLKCGLTVPLPALRLAWSLETRGFRMWVTRDGLFEIVPIDALTDADRAGIFRWRLHLAAIVESGCAVGDMPQ